MVHRQETHPHLAFAALLGDEMVFPTQRLKKLYRDTLQGCASNWATMHYWGL